VIKILLIGWWAWEFMWEEEEEFEDLNSHLLNPGRGCKLSGNFLSTQDKRISTVDDKLSYDFPFPKPPTKQRQKKLPLELFYFLAHAK